MNDILINLTFNINIQNTILGSTIIDTNPSAGIRVKGDPSVTKHPIHSTPLTSITLYPEIESLELKNSKKLTALHRAWNVGFSLYGIAMPETGKSVSNVTKTFMEEKNFVTSDNTMTSRPASDMNALFSSFKWGKSKERVVTEDFSLKSYESAFTKLSNKGIISSSWAKDPVGIHYLVKTKIQDEDSKEKDFLYLIGGSDQLFDDEFLKTLPSNITASFDRIKNFKDSSSKGTAAKSSGKSIASLYSSDASFIWNATEDEYLKSDQDTIKAHTEAKKMLRTIHGIIHIRNSLKYLEKYVKLSSIAQVAHGPKGPSFTEIDINKVIQKYEQPYQYCRNIIVAYDDIAEGKLV